MQKHFWIISAICLSLHADSFAQKKDQDTVLKGATTIEVIQSYKPQARQVPRQVFSPDLPPRDTARPRFKYEVPQQSLNYTYAALPLRPLILAKDTSEQPFPGYVKVGIGNLSTIYLDAGTAHLKGDNYTTAIHLHHLSQQGSINNQKTAFSGLEAEGTLRTRQLSYHASLEALRNQYFRYGGQFDTNNPNYAPKLEYTGFLLGLDAKNELPNKWGVNYHPSVVVSMYGRSFSADERSFAFDLPLSKKLDDFVTVAFGVNGRITSNILQSNNHFTNNVFQLTPEFIYEKKRLFASAGLYPTFGKGGNTYLLPDLNVKYVTAGSKLALFAGWNARLQQNTYKELTTYNPYLALNYLTKQSRYDEVFAGLSSGIGNHFTASGKVSFWQINNMPLLVNDSIDQKTFYVIYDDLVNAISFKASLRYEIANTFAAGVSGQIFNYYKTTGARAWHEPGVRINADVMYRPLPELVITGYLQWLDQIYALDRFQHEEKLSPVLDAGLGAEYSFVPRLSVFLNINNLFNNKYQRWYGYEAYGFNIFGGLRLKF